MEKTVIAKEHLYQSLGSQTTPFNFQVVPAAANATSSHLANDFDYRYAVVNVPEVLTLYARDEFQNLEDHGNDRVRATIINLESASQQAPISATVSPISAGVWRIQYTLA